jgi:hypothetical protein
MKKAEEELVNLGIRASREYRQRLKALAVRREDSIQNLVMDALEEYLVKEEGGKTPKLSKQGGKLVGLLTEVLRKDPPPDVILMIHGVLQAANRYVEVLEKR